VARDLAAFYSYHNKKDWPVRYPDISSFEEKKKTKSVEVEVKDVEGCPRYTGVSISDLHIQSSPSWMQFRLKAIDVRPINNIVDITNYVLHEYGQPLHAFDASKIGNSKVVVQNLPEGSKFHSLDEQERTLRSHDLMICDGQDKGMCIAGVFGGIGSGVTDHTEAIFLESAHFNARRIRKTSMGHNLRTDAAMCFEKGTDPNVTVDALKRAAVLMTELAGATISSEVVDIYPEPIEPAQIQVRFSRINRLIGNDLDRQAILRVLDALGMHVIGEDNGLMTVQIPTDKVDVTREIDVIEEVLRVYGFNTVTTDNRINAAITNQDRPEISAVRNMLADFLVGKGFHEMMGLSLVPSEWYDPDEGKEDNLVLINNTSNVNLDAMRPEMLLSILQSVAYNLNRQQQDLALFEFGNTYVDNGELLEEEKLCIVLAGSVEGESWLQETRSVDFFSIKRIVHEVLARVGATSYQVSEVEDARFALGMHYHWGDRSIVRYGKVSSEDLRKMEIKETVYYAEFSLSSMIRAMKRLRLEVKDISKFPSVRRDLAFIVDRSAQFSQIEEIIRTTGKRLISSVNLFDVYDEESHVGKGKISYALSIVFSDDTKSLKDKEVDKLVRKIVDLTDKKMGAKLR
jgi:phenylalanyl-tRNA synthetase beta chain